MRGTLAGSVDGVHRAGIIPAHAGNTGLGAAKNPNGQDHPRACGEHGIRRTRYDSNAGSSPRMRGTLIVPVRGLFRVGIIPAHAGNTISASISPRHSGDHPRACGEHDGRIRWGMAGLGSSPRMRGTPPRKFASYPSEGIIPAHAGNTLSGSAHTVTPEDHPRACGEHSGEPGRRVDSLGSSPRMRGTLMVIGNTKPHAGNTCYRRQTAPLRRDHPRACGEHPYRIRYVFATAGSSPRMRGTRGWCES